MAAGGSGRPGERQPTPISPAEATDSTSDAGDAEVLRRRMSDDGYLLLRAILPRAAVADVRHEIVRILREAAVGAPGRHPEEAFAPLRPAQPGEWVDVHSDAVLFRRLYSLASLHLLPHHERMIDLASALLGGTGDVLVHPRPALRVVFPLTGDTNGATPPHQDHLGMQGTEETITIWAPLGDCPRQLGVLAIAAGSHKSGERPFAPLRGSRVAGCDADDLADRWVAADLRAGDVLVFHSLAVHSALPNDSAELRLSVDSRYQSSTDPVCAASLGNPPHMSWEELYAGWPAETAGLQRYWERLALDVVPFDPGRLVRDGAAGP